MPSAVVATQATGRSAASSLVSSSMAHTATQRTAATDELEELLRGLSAPWSAPSLFSRIARGAAAIDKLESFLHPHHLVKLGSHATQAVTLATARVILAPVFGCRVPDEIPDALKTALRRSIARLVGALESSNSSSAEGPSPVIPDDVACAAGVMRRYFTAADSLADVGSRGGGEWLAVDDVSAHHTRWICECLLHRFGTDDPPPIARNDDTGVAGESSSQTFRALLRLLLASTRNGPLLAEEEREGVWHGLPTRADEVYAMEHWLGAPCTQPLLRVVPRTVSAPEGQSVSGVPLSRSGDDHSRTRWKSSSTEGTGSAIHDSATVVRLGAELIAAERRRAALAAAAAATAGKSEKVPEDEDPDQNSDGLVVRFDMLAAAAERAAREAERRAALDALYEKGSSGPSLVFVRGQLQQQQQQRTGRKNAEKPAAAAAAVSTATSKPLSNTAASTADTTADTKKKRGEAKSRSAATLAGPGAAVASAPVTPVLDVSQAVSVASERALPNIRSSIPTSALSSLEAMVHSQRRRVALHEALCIGLEQLRVDWKTSNGDE